MSPVGPVVFLVFGVPLLGALLDVAARNGVIFGPKTPSPSARYGRRERFLQALEHHCGPAAQRAA